MAEQRALGELNQGELESMLASLEEELEELGYERTMTLGGTGVHLSAVEAARLRGEFEKDEARIEARMAEVRQALGQ
jgi:hypothetical protein